MVLGILDFTDFLTYDYIKGKYTSKFKKGANMNLDILETIHTDICSPNMDSRGRKYFTIFIHTHLV